MNKKVLFIISTLICSNILLTPVLAVGGNEIDRQQMEAQISFFNNALIEFAATSPDQAVMLWAKGDETRNGVYKYAVACEGIKKELIKKWGPAEKSFWIIGASSPWMTKYNIIQKNEISPTEIKYTVEYEWATSAGAEEPSTEQLWLKKTDNNWCVKRVVQSGGYHSY